MNQRERMSTSRYFKSVNSLLIALITIFIFSSESVYATHIVGGDMSFSCLGNDFYEITLVIRRDCINGAEDAPFDNPASVGIFDSNGNPLDFLGSLGQILLPFEDADTIGASRPDCGYYGGPVCVEEATYKARVFLPFRSKGYILAYQRCCRNVTLNNIISPLETGTTKFVCLTETTLNECNSSPKFQEWPDILVCANQPLSFDHAAIDVDGDSLAYKLYVPHTGATIDFPKPQRFQGPPYDNVQYSSGFSLDNLLGGEPLVIDENTGFITANPNTVGQFLVGVLVEEWRDGELLSKVRRDFEYNVRACEDIADISFEVEEELNCSSLSVSTINTSIDNLGFEWNFNYPSTDPLFFSNEVSPTFTYNQPGNYTISLTSTDPDQNCEVTVLKEIGVFISELSGEIECFVSECNDDSVELVLSTNAFDVNSPIDEYKWNLRSEDSMETLFGQIINKSFPCDSNVDVELIVTSANGCDLILNKSILLDSSSVIDDLIDIVGGEDGEVSICIGDEIALLDSIRVGVRYSWSPMEGLSFEDTINFSDPIASPLETTTYTVTATDGENFDTAMVVVNVLENPTFSVDSDTITICEGAIEQITINTSESNTVTWIEDEGLFIDGLYDTRNPGIRVGEEGGVFVFTISDGMCEVTDSILVMSIPTEVDEVETAIDTIYSYDTTSMFLTFSINASELIETFDIVSLRWTVDAGGELFEGTGGDISVLIPETSITARIVYHFTDSQGCEYAVIYEIDIREEDDNMLSIEFLTNERIIVCEGETSRIVANPNSAWTYTWVPEDFLVFDSEDDKSNPLFVGDTSTTYIVSVTDGISTVTDTILVDVIDDLLELSFEKETATVCFEEAFLFVQNENHSSETIYEWAFDSAFSNVFATEQSVTVVMPSDSVTVFVRAEDPLYCGSNVASINVITIEPNYDFVFDSIDICVSNETMVSFVNNDPTMDYTIQWEQSENIVSALDSESIIVRSSLGTSQVELIYMISNGMGCDIRDTLFVPIDNVIIPQIETDLSGTTICQSVTLSVTSQEDDATYEWSLTSDFAEIVATGSIVDISLPMPTNTFFVRASHPDYCDTTIDSIDVSTDRPDFTFDFEPINICVSDITDLDIIDNDPTQELSIIFEDSDNIVSDINMLPLSIMANDNQDQIVLRYMASNNRNCNITDSLIIDVENELEASIDIDSSSCDGAFGVFRAMVNASEVNYEWSFFEDFNSVLSTEPEIAISLPQGQPIYMRAFTDLCESDTINATLPDDGFMVDFDTPDKICEGDVVIITGSNESREFLITFGDSENIISTEENTVVVSINPGESIVNVPYTAVSTDGCIDEGVIEIQSGEIINPEPESMINCGTTSLSFNGGEGILDGDILWDFGVGSTESDQSTEANPTYDFGMPGTYTVTLQPNRTTCRFESITIEVVVPEPIELATNNNTIIADCSGAGSIALGVMNNLGLPVFWTSDLGDTLTVSDSLQLTSFDGINTITASVADANGCSESIVFNLESFDPDITATFPGNPRGTALCSGDDFEILLVSNDSVDYTYNWSPETAIISGQGTANVIANLSSPQDLIVEVIDPSTGCFTMITIPVDVVDLDLEVVAEPDNEIFLGESVNIIANSTGDIVTYEWDNGSNTMSQIVSPEVTTTYTVTITDVNGCTATGQVTITVIQPECDMTDIFIPSAFSPNNDGNNDVLFVRSNFVSEMDFQIVNRWGQEVFRSTNQRDGWNGRFGGTGKELHPDVYAYCLKIVCVDNQEYIINGTVTLVR